MKKQKWSLEEKLKILEEGKKEGNTVTIRKYNLYPSTYYGWLKRYGNEGKASLENIAKKRKEKNYVRQLEDEVGLLKQLLAERDLEVALQNELLKKKYSWVRKKS